MSGFHNAVPVTRRDKRHLLSPVAHSWNRAPGIRRALPHQPLKITLQEKSPPISYESQRVEDRLLVTATDGGFVTRKVACILPCMALKDLIAYASLRCATCPIGATCMKWRRSTTGMRMTCLRFSGARRFPRSGCCGRWRRNWTRPCPTWSTCSTGSSGMDADNRPNCELGNWHYVRKQSKSSPQWERVPGLPPMPKPSVERSRLW